MDGTPLAPKLVEDVRAWVDDHRDEVVSFLQEIVRIPSETHPPGGDEGPVQRRIAAELERDGLEVDMFEPWHVEGATEHPGWWPGLEYDDRPNVVATYRGAGGGRSLILNGHADVVPAGPAGEWTSPAYAAEIRDGRVYGRGAVDMKGGVTAMIMALRCLRRSGYDPAGTVILESVVNEELGGYNGTLACCVKGYEADAAIVTEPTDFQIAAATKGGQVYSAKVAGIPIHHAWWTRGVSALDNAIRLKAALTAWEEERARETRENPYFSDPELHPRSAHVDTVWYLSAGDPEIMAPPAEAELQFWVDHLPGEDREELLRRFEGYVADWCAQDPFLADHPVRLSRGVMRPFTGVGIPIDHEIVQSLQRAHLAARGSSTPVTGFPAASDSMIFNLYSNTPAVNFGGGDALRGAAHAPDEFIEIDALLDTVVALALAIADFCGCAA
jgi:acetylornithine deacetylase